MLTCRVLFCCKVCRCWASGLELFGPWSVQEPHHTCFWARTTGGHRAWSLPQAPQRVTFHRLWAQCRGRLYPSHRAWNSICNSWNTWVARQHGTACLPLYEPCERSVFCAGLVVLPGRLRLHVVRTGLLALVLVVCNALSALAPTMTIAATIATVPIKAGPNVPSRTSRRSIRSRRCSSRRPTWRIRYIGGPWPTRGLCVA